MFKSKTNQPAKFDTSAKSLFREVRSIDTEAQNIFKPKSKKKGVWSSKTGRGQSQRRRTLSPTQGTNAEIY